jgi:membrane-associated PAP2 superfamily phosphatase
VPSTPGFWISHALIPGTFAVIALSCIAAFHVDTRIADALFYDATTARWLGQGRWWAETLLHDGGRHAIWAVALLALLVYGGSWVNMRLRPWRRAAAFVAVSLILCTGIVGVLKSVTNVDCPWDLERYAGTRPYVGLFADRPDSLPRAACFPGAHSSSGFALLCLYFVFRDRSRPVARCALFVGLAAGAIFSFAQQARGAHFLSHDLTSAVIVWSVLLGLYRLTCASRKYALQTNTTQAASAHPTEPCWPEGPTAA